MSILLTISDFLIPVTILLEPVVVSFYSRLADAIGLPLEQVLCDALFKLAGELSLEAIRNTE